MLWIMLVLCNSQSRILPSCASHSDELHLPSVWAKQKNSNPPCLIMTMVAMRSFLACKNQMAQCQCQSHCNKSQKSKRQRTKCKLPASQSANSDVRKRFPHKKARPPANPSLSEHCHLQRIVFSNPFSSGIFISSKNCFREFSCSFGSQKHKIRN